MYNELNNCLISLLCDVLTGRAYLRSCDYRIGDDRIPIPTVGWNEIAHFVHRNPSVTYELEVVAADIQEPPSPVAFDRLVELTIALLSDTWVPNKYEVAESMAVRWMELAKTEREREQVTLETQSRKP